MVVAEYMSRSGEGIFAEVSAASTSPNTRRSQGFLALPGVPQVTPIQD